MCCAWCLCAQARVSTNSAEAWAPHSPEAALSQPTHPALEMCDAVPACPVPAMVSDDTVQKPPPPAKEAPPASPTPPPAKEAPPPSTTPAPAEKATGQEQKPSTPLVNGRDSPKPTDASKPAGNSRGASAQKNGGGAIPREASSPPAAKAASTPTKNEHTAAGGEGGAATPGTPTANFRAQFRAFSRFGDPKSDGKHLTLSQSDKWLKQARVIDGKKVTTTDTGIYFKKLKQQKLGMDDYKKFLEDLAKNKKLDVEEIKSKMSSCGAPGLSSAASASKTAATIDRLTDTSRYTGAHKQRFDDSGKGKGIAGRKDVHDGSGYVHGYQNKDTYNKTH